jgi:hypothetical protein
LPISSPGDEYHSRHECGFAAGRRGNARVSGGNQQKALFGKGFGGDYDLYIMQIGSYMQMVLLGSLLVLAVVIDQLRYRMLVGSR